jgi:hypothetical protein
MKALLVVLVILVAAALVFKFTSSNVSDNFDPTEQGLKVQEIAAQCSDWIEVLDKAEPPRKWRDSNSNFDFTYRDRFEDGTREEIARRIENGELVEGLSFFYRFSDAATFAVNFDKTGKYLNIQKMEGKGDLMD